MYFRNRPPKNTSATGSNCRRQHAGDGKGTYSNGRNVESAAGRNFGVRSNVLGEIRRRRVILVGVRLRIISSETEIRRR